MGWPKGIGFGEWCALPNRVGSVEGAVPRSTLNIKYY